jgi:hypothetical protein
VDVLINIPSPVFTEKRTRCNMAGRSTWYVYGTINHKLHVYGGFNTDGGAMSKGNSIKDWDSDFRIILLDTLDLGVAKSIIAKRMSGQPISFIVTRKGG